MNKKSIPLKEAIQYFHDDMTLMVGGFMGVGTPPRLISALMESGVKNITLIANDTAFVDTGVGPLIVNGRVKKVIASHIGTNPETGRQMIAGEIDVELVPQGSLAERIRCGGAGLGGVLTQTGVGTVVEDGKHTLDIDGIHYLVERPLHADVALIQACQADGEGNLTYQLSARNFNPLMAMSADVVLAEPEQLVRTGDIHPDRVVTPGAVVDYVILPRECEE